MSDPAQDHMDAEEYRSILVAPARVRADYLASKEQVKSLEGQLRRAKNVAKEANLKLIAAEMALTRRFGED